MSRPMYAFRAWSPPFDPRNQDMAFDTSSAEWSEAIALEVGDRVSEFYFFQMMWRAEMTQPWPWGWDIMCYRLGKIE